MTPGPSRRLFVLALAACAVLGADPVRAQHGDDSAACALRLSAPTADSADVELRLFVNTFDSERPLPPSYELMIAEGVRQFMVLPRAVPTDVYDGRSSPMAGPVIQGEYRAFLHRDGHLTQGRVVGGTLNPVFDGSILRAVVGLDSSLLLPPLDSLTLPGEDSVDVDLVLGSSTLMETTADIMRALLNVGQVPLVDLRLPQRRVTQAVRPGAGNMPPAYPLGVSSVLQHGSVSIQFVVGRDGKPDMRTAEIHAATRPEFATMALNALRHYRYAPLRVEGCAVPSLVVQPFEFRADTSDHTGGRFP